MLKYQPLEEDFAFEEETVHNPYSVRTWTRYIEYKLGAAGPGDASAFAVDVIYERGLRVLPGSYKLWHAYLLRRVQRALLSRPNSAARKAVVPLFERALVNLLKMPVIWREYLRFLSEQGYVTLFRRVLDRALQALPVTQHKMIWDTVLPYITKNELFPVASSVAILKRYCVFEPAGVELLVEALLKAKKCGEAAKRLEMAINSPDLGGFVGKNKDDLWKQLCDIVVEYPHEVSGLNVEKMIRSGITRLDSETKKHFEKQNALKGKAKHVPPKNEGAAGDLWAKLAEYYIRLGQFERARDIFEESLETVLTVADFSIVWDAYTHFEDQVIAQQMTELQEAQEEGGSKKAIQDMEAALKLQMARYEYLIGRHALLVNSTLLRQNPNNVYEWYKRVKIIREQVEADESIPASLIAETYMEALRTIDPMKAKGNVHLLWSSFARFYQNAGHVGEARKIFETALRKPYQHTDDVASLWCDYIEMEILEFEYERARELCRKATMKPDAQTAAISNAHKWAFCSVKLWCLYVDLEESFGTFESTCAVYENALDLKVATPNLILNYGAFLEEHQHYERAFRAYERGTTLFKFPYSMPIWIVYLTKFIQRYGGKKLERTRDLFEQVLTQVPPAESRYFYVLYAQVEEKYGLARHAMEIYDRAMRSVSDEYKYKMFLLYIAQASEFFGVMKTREIYETGLKVLPDNCLIDASLRFAKLEQSLGEIDRARTVFAHCSQFADPHSPKGILLWDAWREFEVKHGNDDTFGEMLRVRRTVQAMFNTTVNVAAREMMAGKSAPSLAEKRAAGTALERLEEEAMASATAEVAQSALPRQNMFTKGETEIYSFGGQEDQEVVNPEELNLEDSEEEGSESDDGGVESLPVPAAVFGGLDKLAEEKPIGALERFRQGGRL